MTQRSLSDWLSYIESQHPSEIELGLDRGLTVLSQLHLSRPKSKVITVAGTNGKGSTCAMLTQYLCAQNYSVGTYTSPHFLKFNERIALNNLPCNDDMLCRAFEVVESARGDIALTYFEFSTLAALWIFDQSELDYWILEVGLGGRLDSVNMVDTDIAVLTSIALDHIDWLGDDLNVIAQEKAGIARKDKLLVSGVVNPPASIKLTSESVGAILQQKGKDFYFSVNTDKQTWQWSNAEQKFDHLPIPSLPLENAATVLAVLVFMGMEPSQRTLTQLFEKAELVGRFQKVGSTPDVYIDVAHNPEAAIELCNKLKVFNRRPIAVCGMLKDKDVKSVVYHLKDSFSVWSCCDLPGPRGMEATTLLDEIALCSSSETMTFSNVKDAYKNAVLRARKENRAVVVFGSFVTVSEYLAMSQTKSDL